MRGLWSFDKQELEERVAIKATQGDDPWLVYLTDEYVGNICFLHYIAERHKLYRVFKIAYWASTKTRFSNWEATLEPIHLGPAGIFYVADEDVVICPKGIRVTKSKVLLGYILAQYIEIKRSRLAPTASISILRTPLLS